MRILLASCDIHPLLTDHFRPATPPFPPQLPTTTPKQNPGIQRSSTLSSPTSSAKRNSNPQALQTAHRQTHQLHNRNTSSSSTARSSSIEAKRPMRRQAKVRGEEACIRLLAHIGTTRKTACGALSMRLRRKWDWTLLWVLFGSGLAEQTDLRDRIRKYRAGNTGKMCGEAVQEVCLGPRQLALCCALSVRGFDIIIWRIHMLRYELQHCSSRGTSVHGTFTAS